MTMIRRLGTAYLSVGVALGLVKLLSAVTWAIWHNFAALPTIDGNEVSHMGSFFMGLFAAMLTVIAWPLSVYQWVSGSVPLAEILLHPWINSAYD